MPQHTLEPYNSFAFCLVGLPSKETWSGEGEPADTFALFSTKVRAVMNKGDEFLNTHHVEHRFLALGDYIHSMSCENVVYLTSTQQSMSDLLKSLC